MSEVRFFLWVVLALFVLGVIGRAIWLADDKYPQRSRGGVIADFIIGIALSVWVAILLYHTAGAYG